MPQFGGTVELQGTAIGNAVHVGQRLRLAPGPVLVDGEK